MNNAITFILMSAFQAFVLESLEKTFNLKSKVEAFILEGRKIQVKSNLVLGLVF